MRFSALALIIIGLLCLYSAVPRIIGGFYAHAADLALTAAFQNAPIPTTTLHEIRQKFWQANAWAPNSSWQRQALSLSLPIAERKTGKGKLNSMAELQMQLEDLIATSPANGALWLQLALIQAKMGYNPNDALLQSYAFTRWTLPLAAPRLQLGAVMWPLLQRDTRAELLAETGRMWEKHADEAVLMLNAPQGGALLTQWAQQHNRLGELVKVQSRHRRAGRLRY